MQISHGSGPWERISFSFSEIFALSIVSHRLSFAICYFVSVVSGSSLEASHHASPLAVQNYERKKQKTFAFLDRSVSYLQIQFMQSLQKTPPLERNLLGSNIHFFLLKMFNSTRKYQTTRAIIMIVVVAAFNFGITIAHSNKKRKQVPTSLLGLGSIRNFFIDAMMLFTFRTFLPVRMVERSPSNNPTSRSTSNSNLRTRRRTPISSTSSKYSGFQYDRPTTSIPMDRFLVADQREADSVTGRAAGMEIMSLWSSYNLRYHDNFDTTIREGDSEADNTPDRSSEPDNE
ncbi:hypothetical protein TWF694_004741 [Orbilia ellipsospora]|uniref:Uncharacterized protein n=1 Tax=Orbilia ellipsospora TaxID=2528407 RepID=A0AAV9WW25_9PEZI